jgi:hypothetical protein
MDDLCSVHCRPTCIRTAAESTIGIPQVGLSRGCSVFNGYSLLGWVRAAGISLGKVSIRIGVLEARVPAVFPCGEAAASPARGVHAGQLR